MTAGTMPGWADCTAIIVTYNSAADIGGLLASLPAAAGGLTVRTVVVDNGSRDATADIVRGHRDVVFVPAGANIGYAAGINLGRRHAGRCGALAVLNPDLVLEPGALRELRVALAENPAAGAVVPALLAEDGARHHCLRREPSISRALGDAVLGGHLGGRPGRFSEIVRDGERYLRRHPIDWATGAAIMVSAECDQAVGGWDERFFLYSEEVDYAARIRAAGYLIEYVPAAVARHRGGGSGTRRELVALMAINRVRYAEKHGRRPRAYRAAVVLHELLRAGDPGHRAAARALLRRSTWPAVLSALRVPP